MLTDPLDSKLRLAVLVLTNLKDRINILKLITKQDKTSIQKLTAQS